MARNQTGAICQRFRRVYKLSLLESANRNLTRSSTLTPTRFQTKLIAPIRIVGLNLETFFTAQAERRLQLQRHRAIRIGDFIQLFARQLARLGEARHIDLIGNTVKIVVSSDDVLLADFFCQPT